MLILVGDIGGTNTRLRLVDAHENDQRIIFEKDYPSQSYSSFIDVLAVFKSEHEIPSMINAVCIAVAGPVKSGKVSVTNLPWVISESELSQYFGTGNVCLINDFIAFSYGTGSLLESDFLTVQESNTKTDKAHCNDAVVIGAGTGLGASHLVWRGEHPEAFSSEAGHAGFAPENQQQTELLSWLQTSQSHVSLEDILSGKGLQKIYRFLSDTTGISESSEVKKAMEDEDPSKIISEYAILESDLLCQMSLDLFVDIYGASSGNIVLHYYPVDMVYIAGGIAAKIKNKLNSERFTYAFSNKGLMSENLKQLTIKLVLNDRAGLFGAAAYAYREFSEITTNIGS